MKRTYNGRRYDTETATLIGHRCIGHGTLWLDERLYRTPRGGWFTHGEGGPDTYYATVTSRGKRLSGEKIRPIDGDVAADWMRRWGTVRGQNDKKKC